MGIDHDDERVHDGSIAHHVMAHLFATVDIVSDFKQRWQQLTVTTDAGELEYIVFPGGPQPFIGATRLGGVPISPADAHVRLFELRHEHASVAYMGEQWADHIGPRRPM